MSEAGGADRAEDAADRAEQAATRAEEALRRAEEAVAQEPPTGEETAPDPGEVDEGTYGLDLEDEEGPSSGGPTD
jgi:hypothetical protein